jgi:hypothetical protein
MITLNNQIFVIGGTGNPAISITDVTRSIDVGKFLNTSPFL